MIVSFHVIIAAIMWYSAMILIIAEMDTIIAVYHCIYHRSDTVYISHEPYSDAHSLPYLIFVDAQCIHCIIHHETSIFSPIIVDDTCSIIAVVYEKILSSSLMTNPFIINHNIITGNKIISLLYSELNFGSIKYRKLLSCNEDL